ncbi:hypothetical protein [Roseibium album]|uniref:hypothetical protein n=1 Tax=Roseibium album TaxID=311410 RepID=UPI003919E43F
MGKNKTGTNPRVRPALVLAEAGCRAIARGGAWCGKWWAVGWNALGDRCRAAAKA